MKDKANISGLSIVLVVFLFGAFFSSFGIRLSLQIPLVLILLIGYVLISWKLYLNTIIVQYFVFFAWVTVLFFRGNADGKVDAYIEYIIATVFMLGVYYYALYHGITYLKYYIYFFIFFSFVIAVLEINFGLVLRYSGKDLDLSYRKNFANMPMSTFYNQNDFATAIGMLFVYIYSYCKIMKLRIRYLILFCCLFIAYFAGSRGVQIAFVLLPIVYSIVNKAPIRAVVKLLGFYVFGFMFLYYLFRNNLFSSYNMGKYLATVESIGHGTADASSIYRFSMIFYTLVNLSRLVIGFGPDGSTVFFAQFPIVNPHNFFIEILVDFGFLGLLLALSIFITALRKNYKFLREDISDNLKASCKATIILLYLFLLFSVVPSSLLSNWVFAWLPIYLTLINIGSYKREVSLKNSFEAHGYKAILRQT